MADEDELVEIEWEEAPRRRKLITVREWLLKHPDASMWSFSWSIWWRVMVMAVATGGLTLFFWAMMGSGNG